jgi:hypothetical protein
MAGSHARLVSIRGEGTADEDALSGSEEGILKENSLLGADRQGQTGEAEGEPRLRLHGE